MTIIIGLVSVRRKNKTN